MGSRNQALEIVERTELGMQVRVAALRRTDGIGAARIVLARCEAVVAPFTILAADRVDRWEIENVEAHVANIGQLPDNVVESTVAERIISHRAWENLIPSGERGCRAIDGDFELASVARRISPRPGARHELTHFFAEQDGELPAVIIGAFIEPCFQLAQDAPILVRGFSAARATSSLPSPSSTSIC